ncbi:imm11 family protein [Aliikangiella sp. IMCC44359]|uniref:imm11 family protein n=1 Tax=Aliikangiella sp. IMCC44359 TaxID=3459125 RepID=UPI00403AA385
MLIDEYYVIESSKDSCLFSWDEKSGEFGMGKPVKYTEPVKLRLGEPIPANPEWLDYHELPKPVISKLLYDALAPLNIYGVQYVPARVRNPKDPYAEIQHYCFWHIWNRIACLDKKNSELDIDEVDGSIWDIEELVLDESVLAHIELEKRLTFELGEKHSVILVHQTVKDAMLSVNPKGVRFFKASEWNSDITFD